MRKALYAGLMVVVLVLVVFAAMLLRVRPGPKPERPVAQIAFSNKDFAEPMAHRTNEITFPLGRKLTVDLGDTGPSGWFWNSDVVNSDPTVLRQVRNENIGDDHPVGMVGFPGTESWTFETLRAGTATLQFTYAHGSTNISEQRRSLKLTVHVQ